MNCKWSQNMMIAFLKLSKIDNDLNYIIKKFNFPNYRVMPNKFETFVEIIIGQQISREAAKKIFFKLSKNQKIIPNLFLKTDSKSLQKIGLSKKKIEYISNLAKLIETKKINLKNFEKLNSEIIFENLIKIKGIGEWTINNYLLFSLQKVDAWPSGDLALQKSLQNLKKLEYRPNSKSMLKLGSIWKPYRGAAALLLWHYHANLKND